VPATTAAVRKPPPKEIAMYAVFGRVDIDSSRADEAAELLNNYTVPMVKQAPRFRQRDVGAVRGRNARTESHSL
jgi:hypothetical protein